MRTPISSSNFRRPRKHRPALAAGSVPRLRGIRPAPYTRASPPLLPSPGISAGSVRFDSVPPPPERVCLHEPLPCPRHLIKSENSLAGAMQANRQHRDNDWWPGKAPVARNGQSVTPMSTSSAIPDRQAQFVAAGRGQCYAGPSLPVASHQVDASQRCRHDQHNQAFEAERNQVRPGSALQAAKWPGEMSHLRAGPASMVQLREGSLARIDLARKVAQGIGDGNRVRPRLAQRP